MTFDEVMQFTRNVSGNAAFEDEECKLFYDTLVTLPPHSKIIEVGVEFGRSTSIILQVAREKQFQVYLIEPSPQSRFLEMAAQIGVPYTLIAMTTHQYVVQGQQIAPRSVGLVHIDGSHTAKDVAVDCAWLLPMVHKRGYMAAHDYGRDSLPEVYPTINGYVMNDRWQKVDHKGTLLVMRRV